LSKQKRQVNTKQRKEIVWKNILAMNVGVGIFYPKQLFLYIPIVAL